MYGRAVYEVPPDAKFSDIIVPTMDTVRCSYLLQTLLVNSHAVR